MVNTLKIDGENGRVAIYEGEEDLALEADPLSDLSRVQFHSDLEYVGFKKITKTHTIPALSSGNFRSERVNLGAHGRGFEPILFAVLRGWQNGSGNPVDLPINGGLLLDLFGQRPPDSGTYTFTAPNNFVDRFTNEAGPAFWRFRTGWNNGFSNKSIFLGAGADGTDLFVWYDQCTRDGSYPAYDLTIDYYVGSRSIDGSGEPVPSNTFEGGTAVTEIKTNSLQVAGASQGLFNSEDLHPYEELSAPEISIPLSLCSLFGRINSGGGTAFTDYYIMRFAPNWAFRLAYYRAVSNNNPVAPAAPSVPSGGFVGMSF
jgi:hypothetical protein